MVKRVKPLKELIKNMNESNQSKWISVKDRLPEKPGEENYEHVRALCYVPRWGIQVLAWNCEHLCWDDESGDDVSSYNIQVTHWQPLPEGPKE